MPKRILVGEGKRFWVECDWFQPQRENYILYDGDKPLLCIGDCRKEIRTVNLVELCELLNELVDNPTQEIENGGG